MMQMMRKKCDANHVANFSMLFGMNSRCACDMYPGSDCDSLMAGKKNWNNWRTRTVAVCVEWGGSAIVAMVFYLKFLMVAHSLRIVSISAFNISVEKGSSDMAWKGMQVRT